MKTSFHHTAALFAAVIISACCGAAKIPSAMEVKFQPDGKVIYHVDGAAAFPALLPFEVIDGKAKNAVVDLGKPVVSVKDGVTTSVWKSVKPAMEISAIWKNDGKFLRSFVEVKNLSGDQLFLLLRQNIGMPNKKYQYWNGRQVRKNVVRNLENSDLYNSFPMTCIYDGKNGYAIGIEPMQIFNHIENGVIVKGERRTYYGVKLVVDKNSSEKVEFITFAFNPEYGYYNAVDEYQKAAKGVFDINPAIDPRLTKGMRTGNTLFYEKLWNRGDTQRSYIRRMGGTWAWGYAPFQAAGDWYGSRETVEKKLYTNPLEIKDYDEFIRRRDAAINIHEKYNLAYFYYIITFCDEKLMLAKYADCAITDTGTNNRVSPWVFGRSIDCRMWGWGNKFAEDTLKNIKLINQKTIASGMAFDCSAAPGIAREQPGVDKAPGRAWDEKGIFVREATATAKWMDFVHTLKTGKYTMGTVGNMAGGGKSLYYTSVRSDALNNDGSFSDAFSTPIDQEVMRFMCGNRPFNYCNGFDYEKYGSIMPWQDYTPEKIREIYDAYRDNILLFMFRYAYYPNINGSWGCEKIVRYIPIGQEVINAGYQTIPAIRVTGNLWFTRYGLDLGTIFFVGNQSLRTKKSAITVDNKYLGSGDYAFAHFDGKPLENTISDRLTKLNKEMVKKEIFLFRPVISFPAGSKAITAKSSFNADFTGGKAQVEFTAAVPVSGKVTFRVPQDCEPLEIRFNGKTVAKNSAEWELPASTAGKFEFIWRSKVYRFNDKSELLDFNAADARIFLAPDADKFDRYAVEHLVEYFKFCNDVLKFNTGVPKVLVGSNIVPGSIRLVNGERSISISKDKSLIISAPTAHDRFELVFDLMQKLDTKYFYFGKFGDPASSFTTHEATKQMRAKGGIGLGANWPGM
ncbi:MAG: hypothetical protein E7058_04835 [Lentisphaerae bacterium]|nr:hypothetical protein [Lentisphaerota bacterium]